jgi:hypothetical protein
MAESKIGMLLMHVYNKIALSLGGGDAILWSNQNDDVLQAQN